jgi:NADH-quinone oxidoreductase subunit K
VTGVVLACLLFCLGLYGVMTRREIVAVLASIEVMLGGSSLLLVVLSSAYGSGVSGTVAVSATMATSGQAIALLLLAVVAVEAAVGLALLVVLVRRGRTRMSEIEEVRG